jgi:hypothetical protein
MQPKPRPSCRAEALCFRLFSATRSLSQTASLSQATPRLGQDPRGLLEDVEVARMPEVEELSPAR